MHEKSRENRSIPGSIRDPRVEVGGPPTGGSIQSLQEILSRGKELQPHARMRSRIPLRDPLPTRTNWPMPLPLG
jgi:hypothetical protein